MAGRATTGDHHYHRRSGSGEWITVQRTIKATETREEKEINMEIVFFVELNAPLKEPEGGAAAAVGDNNWDDEP